MSTKLLAASPTYNKAPSPAKAPNKKLFPTSMAIFDGQQALISLPIPDKLHLSVKLSPEHFVKSFQPDHPYGYGAMIMSALATGQAGPVLGTTYIASAGIYTTVQVAFGEEAQPVFFKIARTPKDADGPHTLSMQLNPNRLTEEGIFELEDRLYKVTGKRLIVGSMLSSARVTRLDVALDVVGVRICDLLINVKNETKRNHRSAADGTLQTIEAFRTKANSRFAIVYDKRAERLEVGESPPHDPAPVTRIEITKTRFGNKPLLVSGLGELPNPLVDLWVGHSWLASKSAPGPFIRYAEIRRTRSAAEAAFLLGLTAAKAGKFEALQNSADARILDPKEIWSGWKAGLKATGTHLLIEAAQTKSSGVPLPPELLDELL